MAQNQLKKLSKQNNYAKSLKNQAFRQRIVKSKKVYDRKKFKIMKFILVFTICSAISASCERPSQFQNKFDTWSECVGQGGELIVKFSEEMREQIEKDKLYLSYFCKEDLDNV